MNSKLRVVIADDERPARSFLANILKTFDDVDLVGEAENGTEAVQIIEKTKPDLALLDMQMPEVDGFGVIRLLKKKNTPLVAFVTAYNEFAIRAFDFNAIDYLLKPVEKSRLRMTITRAYDRLEHIAAHLDHPNRLRAAAREYEWSARPSFLERIPVRHREDIYLLPIKTVASIIADGEILHVTTSANEKYVINYRLKDLEMRLDPDLFVRLSRGTLANISMIARISSLPGGTYAVTLKNGQELGISRLQTRLLRDQLLRL
ncbi:MAG: LytR/AlgR family response regulator transcription factor [Pyrinomonadaceae bacterium]